MMIFLLFLSIVSLPDADPTQSNFGVLVNETPVTLAILNQNTDDLSTLLKSSDPNGTVIIHAECPARRQYTALMLATQAGYLEGVTQLLAADADPKLTDDSGNTALHLAAQNGANDIAIALLSAGAAADAGNQQGQTPLMLAVAGGKSALVETLLDSGADLLITDNHNRSVFSYASLSGRSRLDYRLKQEAGPRQSEVHRMNLILAARRGNSDRALTLLASGVDPNVVDLNGKTPLMYFAASGMAAPLQAALDLGAHLEQTDQNGHTALMLATLAGRRRVIKQLIQAGANINARTGHARDTAGKPIGTDDTALHLAAARGRLEAYRMLLDAGADLDARNLYNLTPEMVLNHVKPPAKPLERDDAPSRLGDDPAVVPPVFLRKVNPCHAGQGSNHRGYIILEAVLQANGHMRDVRVVRPIGNQDQETDAAAAFKMWQFQPATRNGVPEDTLMLIKIDFK